MIEQNDSARDKDHINGLTFFPVESMASHVLKVAAIS